MFGIKWLWKSSKTNIDTSNFVSREFLSTTLQDYVNRDLLNTTLSNELANYVSTSALNTKLGEYINKKEFNINIIQYVRKTQLNTTLADYVQTNTLNTTLANYVQTNTLNTTLSNYVQTSALNNYVSTNTTQTISGAKTFTEGVIINKSPVSLTLKATDNTNKNYIVYKDSSNNSNFSLGANSGQTSLEVNRGDLLIQTQQNNKTVSIETGKVKLNRSILECGTEIYAGYGGGTVKFIPEDNSTKTLQFYNSAATDDRRFNLLVPEPTAAQNPATKNYVDTQIGNIVIPSGISITKTQFQLSGGSVIGVGTANAFTAANGDYGLALPATIDINKVLNITLTLPAIRDAGAIMNYSLTYSYGLYNNVARIVVMVRKNGYAEPAGSLNLAGTTITVLTYSEGGN